MFWVKTAVCSIPKGLHHYIWWMIMTGKLYVWGLLFWSKEVSGLYLPNAVTDKCLLNLKGSSNNLLASFIKRCNTPRAQLLVFHITFNPKRNSSFPILYLLRFEVCLSIYLFLFFFFSLSHTHIHIFSLPFSHS